MSDDRDALLRHGDELWVQLRAALDASMDRPLSTSSDWTGHDVYAHFARWQAQTIADMRRLLAGETPPPAEGDEDTINERWKSEDRALPNDVVRQHCLDTRIELRTLLELLTGEQWELFGRLCAADIGGEHYEEHLYAISAPGVTP